MKNEEINKLISKTIEKTIFELNKNNEDIIEAAVKKILLKNPFKECLLKLTLDEKKEFIEAIPDLITLHKNMVSAKKGAKKVLWVFVAIAIANTYNEILEFFQYILSLLKGTDISK